MALGMKHLPRLTDAHVNLIIRRYGFNVTLRKRTPIVDNPQPCPCIADDDIFNQIDPDCDLCGGTGILGGEAFRDYTIRMVMQPDPEMGFMGSSTMYQLPSKMERVWQNCYVRGITPVDIGDYIIDTYKKPGGAGSVTIEYEVYDKESWWVGQGNSRVRKSIYQKLKIRKTEYAKTISETETY
jgi:hypothetical protein